MPTKLGMGGRGREEYNPNNGEYVEDGIPNKSYDNPSERLNRLFGLLNKSSIGKKYGSKRKQLAPFGSSIEEYKDLDPILFSYFKSEKSIDFFNKGNEVAFNLLKEETGYSDDETRIFQNCLIQYFGGNFSDFRNGKKGIETKIIDEGLKRMGIYDGNIYRGLSFNFNYPEQMESFNSLNNNLVIGNVMNMNSLTSWSSSLSVAKDFALIRERRTGFKNEFNHSILFVVKNNKSAVGMQHVSKFGDGECEVLAPSTSKYVVKRRQNKQENQKMIIIVELEEI